MLPLALYLSDWPVLLVGDGRAALARLDMLEAAGARRLSVFAEGPSDAMRERAGARLAERLPTDAEAAEARVLFTAGLDDATTERPATLARGAEPAEITAATGALLEPWLDPPGG